MLIQRIIFAVLGTALYLCAVAFGDDPRSVVESQTTQPKWADVFPSRAINVFPGNLITFRMVNDYENLTSCFATSPDRQEFDAFDTVNAIFNDIRPVDECSVTVQVNSSHTGSWRLDAIVQHNETERLQYFGTFYVTVQNSSAIYPEPTVMHVRRGTSASIIVGPTSAVSCQLRNPSGQQFPLQRGRCQIDIPVITHAHEGLWTATYSLTGQMNAIEKVTEVIAYDDDSLNATTTTLDNGQVNMLCSVRAYSFHFCQFVKPDGTALNVFEAIGYDKYLYYGHGTLSSSMLMERIHQCGITIPKTDHSDIGTWKCILGTDTGIFGSMLRVGVPELSESEDVVASRLEETVYVVKGDSFTVRCNANSTLKYCWMGSPNGTAYSVSSTGTSPTTLRYDGMGLPLGECGAVIPAAKDTDEGEWKCGMGASNGQEIISIVRVIVTDTVLMPDVKNVTIRHDRAQLSCSVIPGHEESIDYCRWVKPNGFGIGRWTSLESNERHYITYSTTNRCYLVIENVRKSWDTGNWTCVAGLVGSSLEVSATIQVLNEPRRVDSSSAGLSSWCFGIGLGFVSIIIAAVFIGIVRTKFRTKEKPDLPPRYEEDQRRMPPVSTPCTQP